MNKKREKAAEAGREVRRIQREYLREVAREMKEALERAEAALNWYINDKGECDVESLGEVRKTLEKARRLGL